jgi:Tol biopolymer transport system component
MRRGSFYNWTSRKEVPVNLRFPIAVFAVLILASCSFVNQSSVTRVAPTAITELTPTATQPLPSAAMVSAMQTRNKMRIPVGCRFSSISPDFDWVIYTCGNKLWLVKTTAPSDATLVIQDDYISATSWSPDGTEFAVGTGHLDQQNKYIAELWAAKPQSPAQRRLLHRGDFYCDLQLWSPTGKWVLVAGGSGKDSPASLIRTDGTGPEEGITPIQLMLWPYAASWSPDGTRLAYASYEWETGLAKIQILNTGNGMATLFYTQTESTLTPAWSPDGKTIAVLAQSYPSDLLFLDATTKQTLTKPMLPANWEGGVEVFWSPTSDRILVPSDPMRRKVGVISPSSGNFSELTTGDYWMILGWTKDGKSLIILSDENEQEVIKMIPIE